MRETLRIHVRENQKKALIGFKLQIFFEEHGKMKWIEFAVGEAMEYLTRSGLCHGVEAVWLTDEGSITQTFASLLTSRGGKKGIAIGCYSKDAVVYELGFKGRKEIPEDFANWYTVIGGTAYEVIDREGKINCSRGFSFGHFDGRRNQLLNLAGFDKITRSVTSLAGPAREARYAPATG
jgi:hypothetical protein